ncbi:MAG TPA: hypothetical protein VFN87_07090 [Solirubrobacteraceae bacterium]|nr:hypothetical protein [Solirubrobacteraceae bacterium]
MATLEVRDDDLVVTLSGVERLVAMKREVRVPLASVRRVCADPEPWCALRGMRVQGTGIPGVVAYGVRWMTGARPDFAAIHGRGPAVRVELSPESRYGRLLVTVADPQATVAAVRAEVEPEHAV